MPRNFTLLLFFFTFIYLVPLIVYLVTLVLGHV
jgi:hypothetical protein